MYPFDKYYINTNIIASAWITGLTNMNQVMRRIGTSVDCPASRLPVAKAT